MVTCACRDDVFFSYIYFLFRVALATDAIVGCSFQINFVPNFYLKNDNPRKERKILKIDVM